MADELQRRRDACLQKLKDEVVQRVAASGATTSEQIQAIQIDLIFYELASIRVELEMSFEVLSGRRL